MSDGSILSAWPLPSETTRGAAGACGGPVHERGDFSLTIMDRTRQIVGASPRRTVRWLPVAALTTDVVAVTTGAVIGLLVRVGGAGAGKRSGK